MLTMEQALEILRQASSLAPIPLAGHNQCAEALQVLTLAISKRRKREQDHLGNDDV